MSSLLNIDCRKVTNENHNTVSNNISISKLNKINIENKETTEEKTNRDIIVRYRNAKTSEEAAEIVQKEIEEENLKNKTICKLFSVLFFRNTELKNRIQKASIILNLRTLKAALAELTDVSKEDIFIDFEDDMLCAKSTKIKSIYLQKDKQLMTLRQFPIVLDAFESLNISLKETLNDF